MRYSSTLEVIMALAVNEAVAAEFHEIQSEHLLMAVLKFSEMSPRVLGTIMNPPPDSRVIQGELASVKEILIARQLESTQFRHNLRQGLGRGRGRPQGPAMHRSPAARKVFSSAEKSASEAGADTLGPAHLLESLLDEPTALVAGLLGRPQSSSPAGSPDTPVSEHDPEQPMGIGELTRVLKTLRAGLLDQVFGQDHAVHAFVEGLFNAEVAAAADARRRRPKGLFTFAGPPGVGKTFLAELGAEALRRPFKRFDMSGYSDHMGVILLSGAQRSFQGAKEGQLTGFVAQNPSAVLLFDEIEKADITVIHLFLQVLDQAVLEDKFTESNVDFKDTVVIFTTNAGRTLYDDPDAGAKASYHRKTVLTALEGENDPRTGKAFFPQAICSRMATGYPIMFHRLGALELELIAQKELRRTGDLIAQQYGPEVVFGPVVPVALVMREGAKTDARTVRSQAEIFVKTEMFKFLSLSKSERLDGLLERTERILFDLDPDQELGPEVAAILKPEHRASILLVVGKSLGGFWSGRLTGFDVHVASDLAEARNLLSIHDFDFVLLDLWFEFSEPEGGALRMETAHMFDHVPVASRRIRQGQEFMRMLHERYPDLPCYVLSLADPSTGRTAVDDELFLTLARSYGARGKIETGFVGPGALSEEAGLDFDRKLSEIALRLHRSRMARELGAQSQVISFDTAPLVREVEKEIHIRLRNFRISRAVAAEDAGELVSDSERPSTRFKDVFGAEQAKTELDYVIQWLKNPRHFQTMGLRPPKGILLFGPPGTGKTMLARALAGESEVAFIVESATNFVTKWVGSGPENVRNLFARARRYAPSILFIDEIDAIGRKRAGESHNRPQEETLNSLLTEMDGFGAPSAKPVIVLAATNLVESLDPALRRRFDREVEVDRPDRDGRAAYLSLRLTGGGSRQVSEAVVQRLAGQSTGMTIAELDRVIQLAGRRAALKDGVINDPLIEEAFETMRMGDVKQTSDPKALLRVARHEAGHAVVSWLQGHRPVQVTIVARGRSGGFVEREADENLMVLTRPEVEGRIRICLGGRAAEILYYGDQDGISSGMSGDLRQATQYAEQMVRDWGMSESFGLVALDARRIMDGPLAAALVQAAAEIIQSQMNRVLSELQDVRPLLDRVVEALMEKNRLTREDLDGLLGKPG